MGAKARIDTAPMSAQLPRHPRAVTETSTTRGRAASPRGRPSVAMLRAFPLDTAYCRAMAVTAVWNARLCPASRTPISARNRTGRVRAEARVNADAARRSTTIVVYRSSAIRSSPRPAQGSRLAPTSVAAA